MEIKIKEKFNNKGVLREVVSDFSQNNYTYCCVQMGIAAVQGIIIFSYQRLVENYAGLYISIANPTEYSCEYGSIKIIYCPFCAEEITVTKIESA